MIDNTSGPLPGLHIKTDRWGESSLMLETLRDISAGEYLEFNYGDEYWSNKGQRTSVDENTSAPPLALPLDVPSTSLIVEFADDGKDISPATCL